VNERRATKKISKLQDERTSISQKLNDIAVTQIEAEEKIRKEIVAKQQKAKEAQIYKTFGKMISPEMDMQKWKEQRMAEKAMGPRMRGSDGMGGPDLRAETIKAMGQEPGTTTTADGDVVIVKGGGKGAAVLGAVTVAEQKKLEKVLTQQSIYALYYLRIQ